MEEYKPFAIEWINDTSCNVVWKIENHCLNALIDLTEPYDSEAEKTSLTLETQIVPPKSFKWRKSLKKIEKTGNFMYVRFVRRSDRKVKGAESRSQFYVGLKINNFYQYAENRILKFIKIFVFICM